MDNLSSLGFCCICRLSRLGQPFSAVWVTKLQSWVDAWDEADEHVVQPTGPHRARWFQAYLTWYQVRTHLRVTYADTALQPHVASSRDAYARHRDEALCRGDESLVILPRYIKLMHSLNNVLIIRDSLTFA